MTAASGLMAVIPARGGSKGLPGKNIRLFAGLPLIAHSILFARQCSEITRLVVSTDSEAVASLARKFDADVPFLRPAELAGDEAPLWAVLRHALETVEELDRKQYEFVVLLDPTSPAREPKDLQDALDRLQGNPHADGIIGVSRPDFNPIWHCVVERDGWMSYLIDQGTTFSRRQDVPPVYRINGGLYIWRTSFVRREPRGWQGYGRHRIYETPEYRAMSIDDLKEFERAELLVKSGFIRFPWLDREQVKACAPSRS
jgi:N-acylneuraminate cytidylyltransferase